jgi:hypothetical protein
LPTDGSQPIDRQLRELCRHQKEKIGERRTDMDQAVSGDCAATIDTCGWCVFLSSFGVSQINSSREFIVSISPALSISQRESEHDEKTTNGYLATQNERPADVRQPSFY